MRASQLFDRYFNAAMIGVLLASLPMAAVGFLASSF